MTFVDIRMLFLIWAVPVAFLIYLYGFGKRRRILRRFASPRVWPPSRPAASRGPDG